jgi:hypothetical protein
MRLVILDQISDPGTPGKPNDDALCHGDNFAAVFDGATGIGERLVFPHLGSDAAWLANLAAKKFSALTPGQSTEAAVRGLCASARSAVEAVEDLDALPRHAWPTCGFEMARIVDGVLELSGLGDCMAYLLEPDGSFVTHTAIPSSRDTEMAAARRMLDRAGGFGPQGGIVREGETIAAMRRGRDRHNTPDGKVWTLGLVEAAAGHVASLRLSPAAGTFVLLMSDGFSALSEAYQRHEASAMVRRAAQDGLDGLLAQLRHVERVEDPMARQFARFKRCDDATAVLCVVKE